MSKVSRIAAKVQKGSMGSLGSTFGARTDYPSDNSGGVGKLSIDAVVKKLPTSGFIPSPIKPRPPQNSAQDEPNG